MWLLSSSTVKSLIDIKELIPLVEEALIDFSVGASVQPERNGIDLGVNTGLLEVLIGYLPKRQSMAVKALNSRNDNPRNGRPYIYAYITLFDLNTGEALAVMDGAALTAFRTAAGSAVATNYLSRADSRRLLLIGTGRQGRAHLEALRSVRPIETVVVYDIDTERSRAFMQEHTERTGMDIQVGVSLKDDVADADIIQLCTTATDPVILGEWVKAGTHVNSIASYAPSVREADTALLQKSKLVTDNSSDALRGAGELVVAIERGEVTADHLYAEIGEIAAGEKPGRETEDEVTFYKSMGMAVQDVAAATYVYDKALANGLGVNFDLDE